MKRRPRRVAVILAIAAILFLLGAIALPLIGLFLVVADPLERSDAILVMEGATPARELEAAVLYHRGLAPVVVLTLARDPVPETARRLAGLGSKQETATAVLRNVGVPAAAIVRLTETVENSAEELRVQYELARRLRFRRVIIVTSPYHTRRVHYLWTASYGNRITALVHPTPYDEFPAARWWRSRRALEASLHEIFGMLNFALGSPLATFDRTPDAITDPGRER